MTRRTKIVATLGPRTRDRASIRALLETGVDVVRFNFAHEDPATHAHTATVVRSEARAIGRPVGVLVDLPGPKMRTGPVAGDFVTLEAGDALLLVAADIEGDNRRVSTSVPNLAGMVSVGDEIYLADGEIVLRVTSVSAPDVDTEILRGGVLRSRKGMHLPRAERHIEAFTDDDAKALPHALDLGADFIGLSFVRDADDIRRARAALPEDGNGPRVLAKIETAAALDNAAAIVDESDAIMVARGDLGIQAPLRNVPLIQKDLIRLCNDAGVPVITATQMLESMTRNPLPTRAEVTDIANAVLDGTDALMLSEETAVGDYPAAAVATMAEIAQSAEERPRGRERRMRSDVRDEPVSWAVAHAAVLAADNLQTAAILCPTRSGSTPRRVAAFRPSMPIVGLSEHADTLGAMTLLWGVVPLAVRPMPEVRDTSEEVARAIDAARAAAIVSSGDLVAVVAGSPGPRAGRTDFLRVARV